MARGEGDRTRFHETDSIFFALFAALEMDETISVRVLDGDFFHYPILPLEIENAKQNCPKQ